MDEHLSDPLSAFNIQEGEDIWVFGYGSLMWNPGFRYIAQAEGHISGYHRRFCMYSYTYRGTHEKPGLVLGLDRGGSCRGVLFKVAAEDVRDAMDYLWEREQEPMGVYRAKRVPVLICAENKRKVDACVFVINRQHDAYYPETCRNKAADLIHCAHGHRGSNLEYLENTVVHLQKMGIQDRQLEDLLRRVDERLSTLTI